MTQQNHLEESGLTQESQTLPILECSYFYIWTYLFFISKCIRLDPKDLCLVARLALKQTGNRDTEEIFYYALKNLVDTSELIDGLSERVIYAPCHHPEFLAHIDKAETLFKGMEHGQLLAWLEENASLQDAQNRETLNGIFENLSNDNPHYSVRWLFRCAGIICWLKQRYSPNVQSSTEYICETSNYPVAQHGGKSSEPPPHRCEIENPRNDERQDQAAEKEGACKITERSKEEKTTTRKLAISSTCTACLIFVFLYVALLGTTPTYNGDSRNFMTQNESLAEIFSLKTISDAFEVGDTLEFGTYQGEVITWEVLAVESGRALVITKDIIDTKPYNDSSTDVTWETCTLRAWLNNDFIGSTFTSNEKSRIIDTELVNQSNLNNTTTDKLFLLSSEEASEYFSTASESAAKLLNSTNSVGTEYLGKTYTWWLRSSGWHANRAMIFNGLPYAYGRNVSDNSGVRPALWLNLEANSLTTKGSYTWPNGDTYEGDLMAAKPQGEGNLKYANGDIYEGGVVNGVPTGYGKFSYANGDTYEGDFVDGKPNGKGKFIRLPVKSFFGAVYEGDFVDGKPQGEGKISWTNGETHEGDFSGGDFSIKEDRFTWMSSINGRGRHTWPNGDVSNGYYLNGQPNGKGKYTFADGYVLEGNWMNGKFLG